MIILYINPVKNGDAIFTFLCVSRIVQRILSPEIFIKLFCHKDFKLEMKLGTNSRTSHLPIMLGHFQV